MISLKDALASGKGGVTIRDIPNAIPNCLIWPTGRGNYMRQGWARS